MGKHNDCFPTTFSPRPFSSNRLSASLAGKESGVFRRLYHRPSQQSKQKEILDLPARMAGHHALCLCGEWDDIPLQADKCFAEHGDSIDAIIIFIGTNDYNNGVKIGEWYDEKDEEVMYGHGQMKKMTPRKRQYLCMDKDTYRGRINIALDKVKRMYPEKQIVLLTPIHRQNFHANDKNWQCSEDYTNQCGEYIEEYIESVKEAANIWAVPVIDLNALCGLYPMMDEHARYFNNAETDRLHPNDLGHRRIAKTLMYQLLTLPCAF